MNAEKIFNEFTAFAMEKKLSIEGIAIGDEKSVFCEHRFIPDQDRNIYSHTKSYMATAAGIAIEQGVLSLEDRLADYFPEKLPKNPQQELLNINLKHLLTMSSGFNHPYLMNADRRAGTGAPDYMAYMLSRSVETEPGSSFVYSTADSILAGRMIEKAVGRHLGAYMYDVLFSKLGQGYPMWEHDPQGHAIGGGGMFMKLKEMMKLGQLYLARGMWGGERIVSEEWIREAASEQIDTPAADIWSSGYGYQFWMSPYSGSYRADGAYGQITTVLPQQGLVVAFQCPEYGEFDQVRAAVHEQLLLRLTER